MKEKQEFEKLLKEYQNFAKENGICLNQDRKVAESLIKGLIERKKKIWRKILSLPSSYRGERSR